MQSRLTRFGQYWRSSAAKSARENLRHGSGSTLSVFSATEFPPPEERISDLPGGQEDTMCGKFAAKSSWREVTNVLDAMNGAPRAEDEDRDVGYRVMSALPVIVWDVAQQRRRIVAMRWGF